MIRINWIGLLFKKRKDIKVLLVKVVKVKWVVFLFCLCNCKVFIILIKRGLISWVLLLVEGRIGVKNNLI